MTKHREDSTERSAAETYGERQDSPAALDDLETAFQVNETEIGVCVEEVHPVLSGRVRCRFDRISKEELHWVPCLVGVRPRIGDRVLVQPASGLAQGIVTGVVDGFRERIEPAPREAHVRCIRADETIRIEADDGTGLVEVLASASGPVVRLLRRDVSIEVPGALAIAAESIELRARQGAVKVAASEDVVVTGEEIHLN